MRTANQIGAGILCGIATALLLLQVFLAGMRFTHGGTIMPQGLALQFETATAVTIAVAMIIATILYLKKHG
jgi:hypothetical protein